MPESAEQPVYILPQRKARALIPKITSFLALGALFYAGILLNLYLLEISSETESITKIVSLAFLGLIIIISIIISIRKTASYQFYHDRIKLRKKQIYYRDILHTNPKQGILDKIFKTYSINLNTKFVLRNIPNNIQISNYLQQLINYAHRTRTA